MLSIHRPLAGAGCHPSEKGLSADPEKGHVARRPAPDDPGGEDFARQGTEKHPVLVVAAGDEQPLGRVDGADHRPSPAGFGSQPCALRQEDRLEVEDAAKHRGELGGRSLGGPCVEADIFNGSPDDDGIP